MIVVSTALEILLIGLAVWQLVAVRRSMRADREAGSQERSGSEDNRAGRDE